MSNSAGGDLPQLGWERYIFMQAYLLFDDEKKQTSSSIVSYSVP